jgi:hypothetical protein
MKNQIVNRMKGDNKMGGMNRYRGKFGFLLFTFLFLLIGNSFASQFRQGTVIGVDVFDNNYARFSLKEGSNENSLWINLSTTYGSSMLATVLSAMATGQFVNCWSADNSISRGGQSGYDAQIVFSGEKYGP